MIALSVPWQFTSVDSLVLSIWKVPFFNNPYDLGASLLRCCPRASVPAFLPALLVCHFLGEMEANDCFSSCFKLILQGLKGL